METDKKILDFLNNSLHWYLSTSPCLFAKSQEEEIGNQFALYEVTKTTEATELDRLHAIENVLNAFPTNETNIFYIIYGEQGNIRYFYGVAPNLNCAQRVDDTSAVEFSAEVLYDTLHSNFTGSTILSVNDQEKTELSKDIRNFEYSVMVEGPPGFLTSSNLTYGMDWLPTVMQEDDFLYMVLGKRLTMDQMICFINFIEKIDNQLILLTDEIITRQCSDSNSSSCSNNLTNLASNTDTCSKTNQIQSAIPVISSKDSTTELIEENNEIEAVKGNNRIKLDGVVKSKALQGAISNALTNTNTLSKTDSTIVRDVNGDMSAREWRTYLQTVLYDRLNYALGNSLYLYSTILKTNSKSMIQKLESVTQSIYSGDIGNNIPIRFTDITNDFVALHAYHNFQFQLYYKCVDCQWKKFSRDEIERRALFSQVLFSEAGYGGNFVSSQNLGIMISLPSSLSNTSLSTSYQTLEVTSINNRKGDSYYIGFKVNNNRVSKVQKIFITEDILKNHIAFLGREAYAARKLLKRILEQSSLPFLFVTSEDASLLKLDLDCEELVTYEGIGGECAILPMNMFQFRKGNQITTQIDYLKLCFQSIVKLSESLLSLFERACYECYLDYGWDFETNWNTYYGETAYTNQVNAFPCLEDIWGKMNSLLQIEITDVGKQELLRNELRLKVESKLWSGKQDIFNVRHSADYFSNLNGKANLNLTALKDRTDRKLYLALLLLNLSQACAEKHLLRKEFHFLSAWSGLHELFSSQEDHMLQKIIFEDFIEHAKESGLSYYVYEASPNKLCSKFLQQIPTVIVGRETRKEDCEIVKNRLMLNETQGKRIDEFSDNRLFLALNFDSTVYECELE